MQKTQPQPIFTAAHKPVSGEYATPFSKQAGVLTKQDDIVLRWESTYWRVQHTRLM